MDTDFTGRNRANSEEQEVQKKGPGEKVVQKEFNAEGTEKRRGQKIEARKNGKMNR